MSMDLFGWHTCPACPEGDADWPDACWDAKRGLCRSCAHERPVAERKPCSRCGRKVQTHSTVEAPVCRPCRRQLRGLRTRTIRAAERTRHRRRYWSEKRRAA